MSIHLSSGCTSSAPWHKTSFDRFLQERLPELLAERLPLVGYQAESTGRYTCRVAVTLTSASGDVEIEYVDLPQPDEDGLFEINEEPTVVIPVASTEELDIAEIRCVGEQLYDYIKERLGQAPTNGLPWDAELARAWMPLGLWAQEFMSDVAQRLEATNWFSRQAHLRSILIPDREKTITAGQFGRVCPFETPEGPNIGRVLRIAVGAEIHEGKLIVVDERSESGLGLTASMIPFLEHDDANRLLMGTNMMRQWVMQSTPEPALVQTGNEPDTPGFWAGRNLLTAFVSWETDTTWDGIVISKSAAQRFDTPYPIEPGDKMSNRHGVKGIVSRILPDDEMPHLPDGTPVDLVFNFIGLHVRMNFGQVMEAVMGRVARVEGEPAITPPFHAPSRDELRERLTQTHLPESGMEPLTLGRDGPQLERPSTVGWVYWGRLHHLAQNKVMSSVSPQQRAQLQGNLENYMLLDLGVYDNLREYLNTRAIRRADADTLATRVAAGPVEQAAPPTPMFSDLVDRLQVAGIEATLKNERLTFDFKSPHGDKLTLAHPVPHPWMRERQLTEIGAYPALDEYPPLVEANDRLARMLDCQTPEKLVQDAIAQLKARVQTFFDALLRPDHLRFRERQLFSGRAVIAPGADLRLDQVGLANEIAWTLFGPLVIRELDDEEAVRARSERAAQVLDRIMARSWIIVNRAPTLSPTALIAFHPVRDPGSVIRLHPLVCEWLNADFDGDQVAVLLPITESAQLEAGERLSVAGHLVRDPELIKSLLPPPDALWGLASLSLTESGHREIAQMIGAEAIAVNGPITQTALSEAMEKTMARDGVKAALATLEQLTRRGFEAVKASGASISPFIGESVQRPPKPEGDDPDLWAAYQEELAEQILSNTNYDNPDLGPQLIAVRTRQRGRQHLPLLIGPKIVRDVNDEPVTIRHGYAEGLTPSEMYACAAGARRGLARLVDEMERMWTSPGDHSVPTTFTVLARARRANRPGVVFARAAATGEIDPLADINSRLLVGLPVTRKT
ncbi:MAG: hypothetical protein GY832_44070 [Chloroflexi bacterium]|nr:hypothetical protein [Chloroflexota bacterium]